MPKGTLEFQLPEERDEFKLAQDAYKYLAALTAMSNFIRSTIKYSDQESITMEALQEKFYEILREEEVELF